jgi:hypothetical protein
MESREECSRIRDGVKMGTEVADEGLTSQKRACSSFGRRSISKQGLAPRMWDVRACRRRRKLERDSKHPTAYRYSTLILSGDERGKATSA